MKFTLLIIDDEKNIREGLAANFELEGYNVKLAENGKQGLDLISKGVSPEASKEIEPTPPLS